MRVRLTVTRASNGNIARVQGRWSGKPVQVRRGPATVTGEAPRTEPLDRVPRSGKARGGRAREPGDLPPTVAIRGPRGKGVGSMKRFVPGALAGLAAATLLAAPALAAPGTVDRARRGSRRDAPRRAPRVTTATTTPVGRPGQPTCAGTSATGALDARDAGDWAGTLATGFETFSADAQGRDARRRRPSTTGRSGSTTAYASRRRVRRTSCRRATRCCSSPTCFASGCTPASPLRSTACPASRRAGDPSTVRVERRRRRSPRRPTTSAPGGAAPRSATAARPRSTGADGTRDADVHRSADRPSSRRRSRATCCSAAPTCVTTGSDGACGPRVGGGRRSRRRGRDGAGRDADRPAGRRGASRASARRGAARHGQRGPVRHQVGPPAASCASAAGAAGRSTARPSASSAHRCGGSRSFRIGDRAEWSYLLPKRLPRGRYTIRVAAIDKAGNDVGDRDEDPRQVRRLALILLAAVVLAAPAAAERARQGRGHGGRQARRCWCRRRR